MTQNEKVLIHLQELGEITTLTAFQMYGITRLSARIYDLRKNGHKIIGERKEVKNRYGESCYIAAYRLADG